jgi:hypothetical protein
MDYAKYSQFEFNRCGLDSPEARALADDLQNDVLMELHQAVLPIFEEIVTRLNALGHRLTIYDSAPGEVAFRDESKATECALRLAYGIVISAGYSHLCRPGEEANE